MPHTTPICKCPRWIIEGPRSHIYFNRAYSRTQTVRNTRTYNLPLYLTRATIRTTKRTAKQPNCFVQQRQRNNTDSISGEGMKITVCACRIQQHTSTVVHSSSSVISAAKAPFIIICKQRHVAVRMYAKTFATKRKTSLVCWFKCEVGPKNLPSWNFRLIDAENSQNHRQNSLVKVAKQ